MVSQKLHTLGNLKVMMSPREPKVQPYTRSKKTRPLTTSKDSMNSRNSSKGKYSSNYIPKYRNSANTRKIRKDLSKVYKGLDKENHSRNPQIFSPILSIDESNSSSCENPPKTVKPFKPLKSPKNLPQRIQKSQITHNLNQNLNQNLSHPVKSLKSHSKNPSKSQRYGKFIKKPAQKPEKKGKPKIFDFCIESLKNPDIQKLVKMNLDLIQAFSKGIEASRSIISSLASNDETKKEDLTSQLKTIESLSKEFSVDKYKNQIQGVLDPKQRKYLR